MELNNRSLQARRPRGLGAALLPQMAIHEELRRGDSSRFASMAPSAQRTIHS